MVNRKQKKSNFLLFLCIVSFLGLFFWSCSSTPKLDANGNPIPTYVIEDELNFKEVEKPYKYIFLRLYDLDYLNPLYIANILKFGINCTEITELNASHIAINFSLNDDFYALTSGGVFQIAKESCVDPKANKFMKKTDGIKSDQYTYAIRVSEEEYYKTKKFVELYASNPEIKYKASINFKIAALAMRRKFFTTKEGQLFGNFKYPVSPSVDLFDTNFEQRDFVCSTFVAYALMKNISYIDQWFRDHDINFRYTTVTDITQIPGVVRLFSSKFYEYDIAAQHFVEKFPEFKPYFTQISDDVPKIDMAS